MKSEPKLLSSNFRFLSWLSLFYPSTKEKLFTLKMEAARSSETFVYYITKRRHDQEDLNFYFKYTHLFHGAGYYLKSWLSLSLSKNIPLSY